MANKKRRKITRQEWKPNLLLRLLKTVWMAGFSLVKVAIGAVATVVLIIGVCGFVLVGALGDYLQDDVLPNISADLESFEVDQTSFLYCLDSEGNIQQMQRIYTDTNRQWVAITSTRAWTGSPPSRPAPICSLAPAPPSAAPPSPSR